MRVYRVEHPNDPFGGRPWETDPFTKHWNQKPAPSNIKFRVEVCGCSNLRDFHSWWPKRAIKDIVKQGIAKVVVLNAPDARREPGGQVVFTRKSARVIGHFDRNAKVVLK